MSLSPSSTPISITYVPSDVGSIHPGKSKAPQAIRSVDIVNKLYAAGYQSVTEHNALSAPATWTPSSFSPGGIRNHDVNISVCERVRDTITLNLSSNEGGADAFQLIIGGECCILPAILSSYWHHLSSSQRRVGLIYIDADTDLSSPTDPNSTGNFAGMNMTHLLQTPGALESMKRFTRQDGTAVCDASNTVLFGTNMNLPGNTRDHFAYLFDNNFKVVTAASIAQDPVDRAKEALRYLEEKVDVIIVHLDVDAIDPQMFPLANVPNFTGVTFEQMMRALRVFMVSGKVAGLVVAEVNPNHDPGLQMVGKLTDEIVGILGTRNGN